ASFAPPIVSAGDDHVLTAAANQATLTGTATSSAGTIVSTVWSQVVGPSAATMDGENTLILELSDLQEGTYIFKLTAVENRGKEVSDNVEVRVDPIPPNQRPVVNPGINQSLLLPVAKLDLTGTAVDVDGSVVSVLWSQVMGPASAILENES